MDVRERVNSPWNPPEYDPSFYPFWEAWEFTSGGKVWAGTADRGVAHVADKFSEGEVGDGSKGTLVVVGEVKGITNFALPVIFGMAAYRHPANFRAQTSCRPAGTRFLGERCTG